MLAHDCATLQLEKQGAAFTGRVKKTTQTSTIDSASPQIHGMRFTFFTPTGLDRRRREENPHPAWGVGETKKSLS